MMSLSEIGIVAMIHRVVSKSRRASAVSGSIVRIPGRVMIPLHDRHRQQSSIDLADRGDSVPVDEKRKEIQSVNDTVTVQITETIVNVLA